MNYFLQCTLSNLKSELTNCVTHEVAVLEYGKNKLAIS